MKIKDDDLNVLRGAITPFDTPERRRLYLDGDFHNAAHCKDLDMRYRWDLLYASKLKLGDGVGIEGDLNLYAYLNDSHIDTALRSLVPKLEAEVQPEIERHRG